MQTAEGCPQPRRTRAGRDIAAAAHPGSTEVFAMYPRRCAGHAGDRL